MYECWECGGLFHHHDVPCAEIDGHLVCCYCCPWPEEVGATPISEVV